MTKDPNCQISNDSRRSSDFVVQMAVIPVQTDLYIDDDQHNDPDASCTAGRACGDHVAGASSPCRSDSVGDDAREHMTEGNGDCQTPQAEGCQNFMNSGRSLDTFDKDDVHSPSNSHAKGVEDITSRTSFNRETRDTINAAFIHSPDDDTTSSNHEPKDTTNAASIHSLAPTTRDSGASENVHPINITVVASSPARSASDSSTHGTTHVLNTLNSFDRISVERASQLEARRQES